MKNKVILFVVALGWLMQPCAFGTGEIQKADLQSDDAGQKFRQTLDQREEYIKKLEEDNQKLRETLAQQARHIEALEQENRELRDKLEQIGHLTGDGGVRPNGNVEPSGPKQE